MAVGGYDYELTVPNDEFICSSICGLIFKNPVVTPCVHRFCSGCIRQWLRRNASCPVCRSPLLPENLISDSRLAIQISNSYVRCPNTRRGCTEIIRLRDVEAHRRVCGFQRTTQRVNPSLPRNNRIGTNSEVGFRDSLRRITPPVQRWAGRRSSIRSCPSRCRSPIEEHPKTAVVAFVVAIGAIIVIATVAAVASKGSSGDKPTVSACADGGSVCTDEIGGFQTTCNRATKTCSYLVGQRGLNCIRTTPCVQHASKVCDASGIGTCVCDTHFLPRPDGTCGLQVGVVGVSCGDTTPCVEHSTCNEDFVFQCECDEDYASRSDGTCGLKLEERAHNCTSSPCVDHATCDMGNTDLCVCDGNYSPKLDSTCGLHVGQTAATCSVDADCVDYATCSNGYCDCDSSVSLPVPDGTCGVTVGHVCQEGTTCVPHAVCDVDTLECVCDSNHTALSDGSCGLKVGIEGIDCRSDAACVKHATCDNIASLQCVCDNDYGPRSDGTCGLKAGHGSQYCADACVDYASCSYSYYGECTCERHAKQTPDDMCALRVGVSGAKCTARTLCVNNATCDPDNFDQCVCDTHFAAKSDGTCGLIPGVHALGMTDCSQIVCADYSACQVTQSGVMCECDEDYTIKNGRCYNPRGLDSGAINTNAVKMSIAVTFTMTISFSWL